MIKSYKRFSLFLSLILILSAFCTAAGASGSIPGDLCLDYIGEAFLEMNGAPQYGMSCSQLPFDGEPGNVYFDSDAMVIKLVGRNGFYTIRFTGSNATTTFYTILAKIFSINCGEMSKEVNHSGFVINRIINGVATPMSRQEMENYAFLMDLMLNN